MWESKILSISSVVIYWGCIDWCVYSAVEIHRKWYIYICVCVCVYLYTYLDIAFCSRISVLNSQWTNSATHSVRYNSPLRWTATNLSLQQNDQNFFSPDVRRPFRNQVQFVCFGCILCAFSWVCWRCLRKRRIWYFFGLWKLKLIVNYISVLN